MRSKTSRRTSSSAPETASTSSSATPPGVAGSATPASAGQRDSQCARPLSVHSARRNSGSRRRLAGSGVPSVPTIAAPTMPMRGSPSSTPRSRAIVSAASRQSGLRNSTASPRAAAAPRLPAAPKPRFFPLWTMRTRASSRHRAATAATEPSVEALSLTISSTGVVLASTLHTQSARSSPLSAATTTTLVSSLPLVACALATMPCRSRRGEQLLALLGSVVPQVRPVLAGVGEDGQLLGERPRTAGIVQVLGPLRQAWRRLRQQRLGVGLHDRAHVRLPVDRRLGQRFQAVLQAVDQIGAHKAQIFVEMIDALTGAGMGEIAQHLGEETQAPGRVLGLEQAEMAAHELDRKSVHPRTERRAGLRRPRPQAF